MFKRFFEQKKTAWAVVCIGLCGVGYLFAANRVGGVDWDEQAFEEKITSASDDTRLEYHGKSSDEVPEIPILTVFPAVPSQTPRALQIISPAPTLSIQPLPLPSARFSVQPTSVAKEWKVGIQIGHWKNDEVPEELSRLEDNHGASGGGKMEWQVNYMIAWHIAMLLDKEGIRTELLPTVIPPNYTADAFIAIHADGNSPRKDSGFKIAAPWWDKGEGNNLAALIEEEYGKATNLPIDEYIPPAMTHYYAFNYEKFANALAPGTPAVILEAGFLSNSVDRQILIDKPQLAAQGVVNGILAYFRFHEGE
ncbi:MAG: hypothetical protein A2748_02200 [Candidatus Wildermuthbacteria bacterium RIFCSPHIGHO2_01_FULL_45_20]|uniref:MurNAc-LAA domain-containing protein n=1 Tax=Candidatus Wildermuthbacteria bacterium RIFCSPHIGHO2_02_FULL_45_25 TaxID=1802450 RepID=A0A1G2R0D7_9BACT|nr:MAG: hypothetical protein A2748_02200 [Candidatus Wildermuthbacteria bacterium RIFCSPHIGHO2_01_FULL_45_20]OHA65732.1 MAG: hypothetical protein A3C04_02340 [Candidatus Wildermuthbacteria bacterium RIFCSPHIGHO2_02_FULL_45_25]